jgi:hypothetical protein
MVYKQAWNIKNYIDMFETYHMHTTLGVQIFLQVTPIVIM